MIVLHDLQQLDILKKGVLKLSVIDSGIAQ